MARTRAEEDALAQSRANQRKKLLTPTPAKPKPAAKPAPQTSMIESLAQNFRDLIGVTKAENGLKGNRKK